MACASRVLVLIPLSALLATDGFIKGVVVFQVDLGYVADFRCRRCLDGDSAQVVLSSEVELEPGVKVECVSKFCYLGDTLGSGGGVVEAARARVRCAWAKFKELSPILTVRGASYRIKGRIYSACVQSVLIYGTETWALKADDLRSLERTERMMVRWMCGVSLKDRKRSEDLCNLLGINCVADVVRRGRLRWFGHLERKSTLTLQMSKPSQSFTPHH